MRHYLITISFCCLSLATESVWSQILLDPNIAPAPIGTGTGTSSRPPGIIVGDSTTNPNPLLGQPANRNDPASRQGGTSSPWNNSGSLLYGSGGGAGTGDSTGSGGLGYYGGLGVSPRIYRGMTREEIVLKQAELKMLENLEWEERMSRIRANAEAKQNMERGLQSLQSLFNESGSYVPQVLGGNVSPETVPSEPKEGTAVPTEPDKTTATEPKPTEEKTPSTVPGEDPVDAELRKRRAEIEKQEDSEQKQKDLEVHKKREEARQRWLKQRAEAERGALFFSLPQDLQLSQQRLKEGWCNLFDGKTPFGWRVQDKGHYGGGRFFIQNGELRSDPTHPGLIYTTNQFGDCTVMLEYQADADSEVYLLLRTSPDPHDIHTSCYAVVLNSGNFTRPTGTVLGRHELSREQLAESAKSEENPERSKKTLPGQEQWARITAQFEGTRLQVTLNRDEPITLFDAKPLGYGYIGLLVTKGNARFRRMFWKPGSTVSLFDPINPERFWRYRKDAIQLRATREGTLQLTGGPGVFESKMEYDNFVIQFEYNIAYNSARTGLFFRSPPRLEQGGYEMSIQNFPTREDRDKFVGVDVGSFRGIKNGRYLRPEDLRWNFVTLLAVDRQFQTWVNGVPVCEMSDHREPTDAADKPPFLEPGTIQFLAPKAGTSIDFRNIRISPIAPRVERPKTFEDRTKSTWEEQSKARRERERQDRLDQEMMDGNKKEKAP